MVGILTGFVIKFFLINHAAEYGIEGAVVFKSDFAAYAGVAAAGAVELAKKLAFQFAVFAAGRGIAGKG